MTGQVRTEDVATGGRSAADACLWPLLSALDWIGEKRQLSDALPEGRVVPDFATLLKVLQRLNYQVIPIYRPPRRIEEDMLPALIERPDGDVWVVLALEGPDRTTVFKGGKDELVTRSTALPQGKLFVLREAEPVQPLQEQGRFGWLGTVLEK